MRLQRPAQQRRQAKHNAFRQRLHLETANSITHGIGTGACLAGAALLVAFSVKSGDIGKVVSASIYGFCMALVFLSSTLYHATLRPRAKRLFNLFDHSAIFLAIAGTYTPIAVVLLRGSLGWWLLACIWIMAAAGILFKTRYINRFTFLSTSIYVVMGWSILLVGKSFSASMPGPGLVLFFSGGAAYTIGTIFYGWRGLKYHHMIWHLFVLTGALLHFLALYLYVY